MAENEEDIITEKSLLLAISKFFMERNSYTEKELVFYLSMDMRWVTPKTAQKLMESAIDKGFIRFYSGGIIKPLFDYNSMYNKNFRIVMEKDGTFKGMI